MTFPKADEKFTLNVIPLLEDHLIHLDKYNCDRFASIIEAAEGDPEVKMMNKRVDADLEKSFYPELRKLTGLTDADAKKLRYVCNYINWAVLSDVELKFELNEQQVKLCKMVQNTKNLALFDSSPELWQSYTYEIAHLLRDLTKVQEGQQELSDSTTFMKYYARLGKDKPLEETPKFIFYSGHSETLKPLIRLFGARDLIPFSVPASSMMLFNFYQEQNETQAKHTVDLVYVRGEQDPLVLFSDTSEALAQLMTKKIDDYNTQLGLKDATIEAICDLPLAEGAFKLAMDAKKFQEELYKYYNFQP